MRKEICREFTREFGSEENYRFSYNECEHAATHYDAQRSHFPKFSMTEIEVEEKIPRRETLSDFLQ